MPKNPSTVRNHAHAHRVMTTRQQWTYAALMIVGVSLTIAFGVWWFRPSHIPENFSGWLHGMDILAYVLLSYIVWYQICNELFAWYLTAFMKHPELPCKAEPGLRVALLTAFVPGKEPCDMLERTLQAMTAAYYPHDTWVLDEGNDDTVKSLCARYGALHYSRKGKPQYNTESGKFKAKTKAGNYNSWFLEHGSNYDIVAQHDVDFVPSRYFLSKTLGYFADPDIAFVGTPQIYGNKNESWIARGSAEQAYGFYGHIQKGLHGHNMSLFIGANHIVRMQAHDAIEGYAGHIVEDHLTGMRFYAGKWKSVYIPEILAVGEGPATWDAYFSQQMRWAYGLIDIYLRHSPSLFRRMRLQHVFNYFILQQYYFCGVAQVIGIALMTAYFLFGFQATSMALLPLLVLYVPLLTFQILFFLWSQRFNVDYNEEKGLLVRGRLLTIAAWPIYFVAFVGALMGKKLTYAVTPKGTASKEDTNVALFLPHAIIGLVSALGIAAGILTGHHAPQILFWAAVNTTIMYGLILSILLPAYARRLKIMGASMMLRWRTFFHDHGFTVRGLYDPWD